MADQAPLDLRALADVDSPEVVRAALKSFRRRLLTRYVWIGLVVVLIAVGLWANARPDDLAEEVDAANPASFPDQVWRFDDASVALTEVGDLGMDVGLHFVVIPDDPHAPSYLEIAEATQGMGVGSFDVYERVPDGVPQLHATLGRSGCVPHCDHQDQWVIDLSKLRIPANIWRSS